MKPIPISAAEKIAKQYGYDQIIVIGRKVGEPPDPCGEHVTTYGVNRGNCRAAAKIGDFLKYNVMGWERPKPKRKDCDVCNGTGQVDGSSDEGPDTCIACE